MTDLVERYLAAVQRRLPEDTAKDIVAELREALSAQIEAKEDALGRAASADEVAAVLKAYGHPVVVASRYAVHDYLIGPNYYAWFWHVQRRALGTDEPVAAVMRGFGGALHAAIFAFGVVTALFVLAERQKFDMKWAERWNPKDLPRENIRKPRSLFESAISLFFDLVFIMFWVGLIPFPNEMPVRNDASVAIVLSPAWEAVYWPVLMLAVLAAVGHAHDLVRPAWNRVRSGLSIAGYAGGLAVVWVLFQSQPLVEVLPKPDTSAEDLERAVRLVEGILTVALWGAAVVWVVAMSVEIWRQVKASRASDGAAALAV
jgi:hypothetical protein